MTDARCRYYEKCSAPICPLDEQSLKHCIWYPDEEICKTQGDLPWVKAQRKMAKSAVRTDRYFTPGMLKRNCVIKRGITGLDPDEPEKQQLKKWLDEHPMKKEMSDEEKKARVAHLKKYWFGTSDKHPPKEELSPVF